ncbi:MAG: glycosyltransferase family 4 protein [Pseudomonadota bacterium]
MSSAPQHLSRPLRVAFYAPMKAPDDPVPSGDREIARLTQRALEEAGAAPFLVSDLRIRDGEGDPRRQAALAAGAKAEASRLTIDLRDNPPDAWLTYHCYYKAPDLLGPAVTDALDIPYAISEPSIAPRRREGPWAEFAAASEQAIAAADRLFWTTERDRPALAAAGHGSRMVHLPPFVDASAKVRVGTASSPARLLTVAMMRQGDKQESYRRLSAALDHITLDWTLDIVGDGPAADSIQKLFLRFGSRVRFLGAARDAGSVPYAQADCLIWPGVGEGVGMVWLEAQAAGCPVVAETGPAACAVVEGGILVPPNDPAAFAAAIETVLSRRTEYATRARKHIQDRHSIGTAARIFSDWLSEAVKQDRLS